MKDGSLEIHLGNSHIHSLCVLKILIANTKLKSLLFFKMFLCYIIAVFCTSGYKYLYT